MGFGGDFGFWIGIFLGGFLSLVFCVLGSEWIFLGSEFGGFVLDLGLGFSVIFGVSSIFANILIYTLLTDSQIFVRIICTNAYLSYKSSYPVYKRFFRDFSVISSEVFFWVFGFWIFFGIFVF